MTEAPVVLLNRLSFIDKEASQGSLGKPLPNTEVKIINTDDPTGTPLGPNEPGELLVKGTQVMRGYLNRSQENVFLDGWFRTGDMMYYNDQGYLFITDRLKELIKVKGFQVSNKSEQDIIFNQQKLNGKLIVRIEHEHYVSI